jgi:hypothetical protein
MHHNKEAAFLWQVLEHSILLPVASYKGTDSMAIFTSPFRGLLTEFLSASIMKPLDVAGGRRS